MINKFKTFRSDETGAVTVDWVVLTAAVVLLAAGVTAALNSGDANSIGNQLQSKVRNAINTTP